MRGPSSRPRIFDRLRDYFGVQPSEVRPTVAMSLYLFLGIGLVICLKAAADSLFLSEFDAKRLPIVDLAITALVGMVVGFYLRLSNRMSQGRLTLYTQFFLMLNLIVLWYVLRAEIVGGRAVLYVWVGIFAVLIPSQVWSLAATLFDTRQAKRLFSLIGSGGILGAAFGGQFASWAADHLGTENILLAALLFLLASSGIVSQISSGGHISRLPAGSRTSGRASIGESLRLIRSSRYLTLITAGLFLSTVVSTLVKYQFKAVAQLRFVENPADMTQFFGTFAGYIAVISFLLHTLFSGRLLRWFGLGLTLFILPTSLLAGASALVLSASLWAAVAARGFDQGFRHSVDRASIELLYVPLPDSVRSRVKSFLDMVVGRSADGLASIVLLLLVSGLQLGLQEVGMVSLLCTLPWLLLVWQLRAEYISHLRRTIERKDLRSDTLLRELAESAPPEQLIETLEGSDQRAIESAVDWMQYSGVTAAQAHLASLLTHESSPIRRKAMAAVAHSGTSGCQAEVRRFLELEPDIDSRWQALEYLETQDADAARASMASLLQSEDRDLAATAACRLLHHEGPERDEAQTVFSYYVEAADSADQRTRATAARLLGLAPRFDSADKQLSRFLGDSDVEVVRAALLSAAVIQPRGEISRMISFLSDHRLRAESRSALAAYGESIVETLVEKMRDPSIDVAARRRIARIIGAIGGPKSATTLMNCLSRVERVVGFQALRALSRIRTQEPRVSFDARRVSELLHEELRGYYQELVLLQAVPNGTPAGVGFLRRALQERIDHRLDWIFHLLGLIYPQREILDARYWIASGRPELRSNAVEFLDSRLTNPFRQMLLPLLDDLSAEKVIDTGRSLFELRQVTYPSVLWQLLEMPDPWMQTCACYAAAESKMHGLRLKVRELAQAPDALLAETAAAAYARL